MPAGVHLCNRNSNERNDKKNTNGNVQKEKRGRWNTCLPKVAHCAEARCISVKGNTVNSLAVVIIQIAREQRKLIKEEII